MSPGTLKAAVIGACLIASCTPSMNTAVTQPPPQVAPRAAFVEVESESRSTSSTHEKLCERLRSELAIVCVEHPALADLEIHYREGDSSICLDCDEEPLPREWWWLAQVTFPNGGGAGATLSGSVDKFRGRPERFVVRQLAAYLRRRGSP